jgi:hypothetical protein
MPAAIRGNDRISLFRTPSVSLVRANPVVNFEDRIDHRPSCFNRVLAREECAVAGHGVAQKPFVGRFLSGPFFQQVKLSLLSDEILAR